MPINGYQYSGAIFPVRQLLNPAYWRESCQWRDAVAKARREAKRRKENEGIHRAVAVER